MYPVTYPAIFWGYCLYLKSLILVSYEVPSSLHGGAEELKMFKSNTSTLLEKALKTLPSHLKFEQAFIFLLSIFYAPEFGHRYCMCGIKILLDTLLV